VTGAVTPSGELRAHVYLSPTEPIPSAVPGWDGQATWPATTATLLVSDRDALLVDALMTTAESQALGEWCEGLGRRPSTVYVTHGHADHFFGATPLRTRWPGLRLVAVPAAVPVAAQQVGPALLPF
jgi:glyoxylase-like metal-dependent hydrolase (beta-lactamase superfamily II)